MTFVSRVAAVTVAALMCWTAQASAQQPQQAPYQQPQQAPYPQAQPQQAPYPQAQPQPAPYPPPQRQSGPETFGPDELVSAGHKFFGNVSRGLASIIERAVSQWGLPNGYVLGEEGSGAFVAGLRYGEGTLYTKNAGDLRVYWQGPSVGFDWGGDGARTMTLVYNLPATAAIYQRFVGIDGSAYIVGGFGMTALTANNIVLVPIRSGIGLRLGANVGYLKFTPRATWNPFSGLFSKSMIRKSEHRFSLRTKRRAFCPEFMRRPKNTCVSPGRFRFTRQQAGVVPVRHGIVTNNSLLARSNHP